MQNRLSMASAIAVWWLPTVVVAQAPKMGARKGGPDAAVDHGKIARELGLTRQMEKLKQIHAGFMDATKDTREQLRVKWGRWLPSGRSTSRMRRQSESVLRD